ncbi:16S rRNA (cytosine(967)-C(5))-methyltransferase RsmB [Rhodoferax mekongensis]|uniref:16S rRNA (Cytosine(967)-C(5))-methyltransferase RsmB n=1 Tax=Rhodoferax mekongensis TaxID=3068341 RepID=A0ABZ0AZQ1_9BURK|nr:16S rRNA (cytosine(967)-C(5))-methyltransferase RsmB [Rhodoferax sp. TBRC 17307]WNO04959.1 16S rRNA (cytosine(967)-C(5))-methyltransferase RsmB [Rhodoferax sp. TBRC 17307]
MTENERTPPLWRQLQATVEVLKEVAAGVSGSAAMERVPTQLRGGVQALSFHAWRNMGRAKAIRALLAKRPPPADVDALLCLVLALLWDPSQVLYDDFTLVNQAVESAKKTPNTSAQASFINACLRRFLRERDALIAATEDRPEARWNHPAWWIKRVKQDHPQHWQAILQNANRHPPMTLRVNVRKIQGADYAQKLKDAGVEVARTSGSLIELSHPVPVTELPGFADGWVSVQDGAAQWAAKLLLAGVPANAQAKVLDACAAPGGKTAHLLEISDAEVLALEIDSQRTERIYQTLNRLGLSATVKTADAAHPETWWNGSLFDYVLLDAPCTASGIARRHPDIRWLRRESDVLQLAAEQRKLLVALWPTLKPGGKLLYCTCSIFRAEGSEQVKSFLDSNRDAVLLPSPGHLLPQSRLYGQDVADNWQGDHDGFFYALFEKKHF